MPRSIVHDHDHDHHEKICIDDEHSSDASFEEGDCFVCEFQLDFFEIPQFKVPKFKSEGNYAKVVNQTDKAKSGYVSIKNLRGPPQFV